METFSALLALSADKDQWHGALMFSMIYAWINDWENNREAGDLRRHRGLYDVNVMSSAAMVLTMEDKVSFIFRKHSILIVSSERLYNFDGTNSSMEFHGTSFTIRYLLFHVWAEKYIPNNLW